jgi:hypothetical protein
MLHNDLLSRTGTGAQPAARPTVGRVGLGVGGTLVGLIVGFIVGANIGGNWMTSFELGSLHGYEATAPIGAVVGALVLGVLSFWLALRRR